MHRTDRTDRTAHNNHWVGSLCRRRRPLGCTTSPASAKRLDTPRRQTRHAYDLRSRPQRPENTKNKKQKPKNQKTKKPKNQKKRS